MSAFRQTIKPLDEIRGSSATASGSVNSPLRRDSFAEQDDSLARYEGAAGRRLGSVSGVTIAQRDAHRQGRLDAGRPVPTAEEYAQTIADQKAGQLAVRQARSGQGTASGNIRQERALAEQARRQAKLDRLRRRNALRRQQSVPGAMFELSGTTPSLRAQEIESAANLASELGRQQFESQQQQRNLDAEFQRALLGESGSAARTQMETQSQERIAGQRFASEADLAKQQAESAAQLQSDRFRHELDLAMEDYARESLLQAQRNRLLQRLQPGEGLYDPSTGALVREPQRQMTKAEEIEALERIDRAFK